MKQEKRRLKEELRLKAVPLEKAIGEKSLHDMTCIIPHQCKGPAFKSGQEIKAGDISLLRKMGRKKIYVESQNRPGREWVHENDAALAFARWMAGEGVSFNDLPNEGKVTFVAGRDGLFVLNRDILERFNLIPDVMCASRQSCIVVEKGDQLAGTRAIPLYLSRKDFQKAEAVLKVAPLFRVLPLRAVKAGILVTGTEVFQGLIEDKFIPILSSKVKKLGGHIAGTGIVPDERGAIRQGVVKLLEKGIEILICTAGMSVDPDDVTRQGLMDAGATDIRYGAPILPGAMTMLARIGEVQVICVPACGLYYKTTSFDLLFPQLLAGLEITRKDLARMAEGSFCLGCKTCTFPHCSFGK